MLSGTAVGLFSPFYDVDSKPAFSSPSAQQKHCKELPRYPFIAKFKASSK
jgi:hypothetical protein